MVHTRCDCYLCLLDSEEDDSTCCNICYVDSLPLLICFSRFLCSTSIWRYILWWHDMVTSNSNRLSKIKSNSNKLKLVAMKMMCSFNNKTTTIRWTSFNIHLVLPCTHIFNAHCQSYIDGRIWVIRFCRSQNTSHWFHQVMTMGGGAIVSKGWHLPCDDPNGERSFICMSIAYFVVLISTSFL